MEISDLGAQFRAKYRLKAILLATAVHSGATGYIGNDIKMKRFNEIEVLILSDKT